MAKGVRSNDSSADKMGEIREIMQKLIANIRALSSEVSSLKQLDQTINELKEKLVVVGEHRRDNGLMEQDDGPSEARQSVERPHRERSPINSNTHNSIFSRWSRMEFLRFAGEDLRSWLFKIEQFFSMENVAAE